MVTLGWKALTEKAPAGSHGRTVSAPIEHQGVRNALRGAFDGKDDPDLPDEMRQLLNKIH